MNNDDISSKGGGRLRDKISNFKEKYRITINQDMMRYKDVHFHIQKEREV